MPVADGFSTAAGPSVLLLVLMGLSLGKSPSPSICSCCCCCRCALLPPAAASAAIAAMAAAQAADRWSWSTAMSLLLPHPATAAAAANASALPGDPVDLLLTFRVNDCCLGPCPDALVIVTNTAGGLSPAPAAGAAGLGALLTAEAEPTDLLLWRVLLLVVGQNPLPPAPLCSDAAAMLPVPAAAAAAAWPPKAPAASILLPPLGAAAVAVPAAARAAAAAANAELDAVPGLAAKGLMDTSTALPKPGGLLLGELRSKTLTPPDEDPAPTSPPREAPASGTCRCAPAPVVRSRLGGLLGCVSFPPRYVPGQLQRRTAAAAAEPWLLSPACITAKP